MGSKGSQTTQTTNQNQSYTANPAIQGAAYQALSGAESAASQPFQMPAAPVAGFSPLQQQAFNQYQSLQGSAQPYYNQAQGLYQQSAAPVSATDVSNYYNPMASNITAQMENIFGQQNTQNTASLTNAAGGVGADRIAVGQANMANQQGLAAGQTYAGLYQQALQAAQQQKQAEAGAASGIQGLGTSVLGANLQGTNALYQAGAQQQGQTQAELNAPYQQKLAQLAYPFQTAQYLAGITGGLAPALGGTTLGGSNSVTTPPTPSALSQALGLGAAGAGIYGSLNSGNSGKGSGTSGSFNPYDTTGSLYADGGEVDSTTPGTGEVESIVPKVNFPMGAGHSGPLTGALQTQQPQQQSGGSGDSGGGLGDVLKIASTVLPFLGTGGKVRGYDDGGDVDYGYGGWGNKPLSSDLEDITPPPPPLLPSLPPASPAGPIIRPGSIADRGLNAVRGMFGQGSPATPETPGTPVATGDLTPGNPVPFPGVTGQTPLPTPPNRVPISMPTRQRPAVVGAAPVATASQTPAPSGATLPYPDALTRDKGQDVTRSPWMALIQAGAAMASTPGPLGVSIGKGLQAGAKTLEDQRKELRSEQQLNDKAKQLYETAQEHLDKYNKMTPYERGSLAARNKEIDQSGTTIPGKPVKFTGADYDRAAKFVQSMNPGLPPEQLQPMIDAEVSRRRRSLTGAIAGAPQQPSGPSPGTISNAKAAIAAGARIDDVINKARQNGINLTPDMLQ